MQASAVRTVQQKKGSPIMTPTRTILTLSASTILASLLSGCVETSTTTAGAINTDPLIIDPAMLARNWEPTVAYYANGDTESWSTGYAYTPRQDLEPYQYYFADTGTYFVNLVTSPYTFYKQRDGSVSTGVQLPPTYTAMPPVPPSYAEAVESPTTQPTP
jgi:hypothetical protein